MEETVKVIIRVRPNPESNFNETLIQAPLIINESKNQISITRGRKGHTEFTFSSILNQDASQTELYEDCSGIVDCVVQGINCCVMAYGQTGSGKTYSMFGQGWEDTNSQGAVVADRSLEEVDEPSGFDVTTEQAQLLHTAHESETQLDSHFPENQMVVAVGEEFGIVPRSVVDLFRWLEENARGDDADYSVDCQLIQIYNDKLFDLLQDKKRENPLQLRENGRSSVHGYGTVYVAGLSSYRVESAEDVFKLLRRAVRNRAIRGTEENAESSRSHCVLQLHVQVEAPDGSGAPVLRRATMSLVDLAGSEKWRPSMATQGVNSSLYASSSATGTFAPAPSAVVSSGASGAEAREQSHINSSLHALGLCVSALLDSGRKHIPFRNSNLTRLLQDALSGMGRTILVATVRDGLPYVEETLSTLQFAGRAARIRSILVPLHGSDRGKGGRRGTVSIQSLKNVIRELKGKIEGFEHTVEDQQALIRQLQQLPRELPPKAPCPNCAGVKDLIEALQKKVENLVKENRMLREQWENMTAMDLMTVHGLTSRDKKANMKDGRAVPKPRAPSPSVGITEFVDGETTAASTTMAVRKTSGRRRKSQENTSAAPQATYLDDQRKIGSGSGSKPKAVQTSNPPVDAVLSVAPKGSLGSKDTTAKDRRVSQQPVADINPPVELDSVARNGHGHGDAAVRDRNLTSNKTISSLSHSNNNEPSQSALSNGNIKIPESHRYVPSINDNPFTRDDHLPPHLRTSPMSQVSAPSDNQALNRMSSSMVSPIRTPEKRKGQEYRFSPAKPSLSMSPMYPNASNSNYFSEQSLPVSQTVAVAQVSEWRNSIQPPQNNMNSSHSESIPLSSQIQLQRYLQQQIQYQVPPQSQQVLTPQTLPSLSLSAGSSSAQKTDVTAGTITQEEQICSKHRLRGCILCQMYTTTTTSSPSMASMPSQTHFSVPLVHPSLAAPKYVQSVPAISVVDAASAIVPQHLSLARCTAHNLIDCLLCRLKSQDPTAHNMGTSTTTFSPPNFSMSPTPLPPINTPSPQLSNITPQSQLCVGRNQKSYDEEYLVGRFAAPSYVPPAPSDPNIYFTSNQSPNTSNVIYSPNMTNSNTHEWTATEGVTQADLMLRSKAAVAAAAAALAQLPVDVDISQFDVNNSIDSVVNSQSYDSAGHDSDDTLEETEEGGDPATVVKNTRGAQKNRNNKNGVTTQKKKKAGNSSKSPYI